MLKLKVPVPPLGSISALRGDKPNQEEMIQLNYKIDNAPCPIIPQQGEEFDLDESHATENSNVPADLIGGDVDMQDVFEI